MHQRCLGPVILIIALLACHGISSAVVRVAAPPPTANLSAQPSNIATGETVVLTWSSSHAQTAVLFPDIGPVAVTGTLSTTAGETVTYTLTVYGPGGSAQSSATVKVYAAPVAALSAGAESIPLGGSTTLNWSTTGATAVYIEPAIGAVAAQGTLTVSPEATTTYRLTAIGRGGTAGVSRTVAVTGSPQPQPMGSFGRNYQDIVPVDATVVAYDPRRFALVTGLVWDAHQAALEGVAVSIVGRPEYGTAVTGRDGRFSLPVEGGGTITAQFAGAGFISVQRQVFVPWNDIAVVETVHLITEDAAASVVNFDGNPATIVTHRSTEVSDASGVRSATLVFTGDNRAYLTDKAGDRTLELRSITTRATEYPTQESMPAKLPETSAFTWCAELQVDGAERVTFEKPVPVWVENFLGFPVGEVVPVGYYDRDKAAWIPMKNGVVVALLDTDGDGVVDALDSDGDGQPDDLNKDGRYIDEVRGLGDPRKYPPGATFWRAEINHFSPIDFNWPFGPPPDAVPPNAIVQAHADLPKENGKDTSRCLGSFLEEKSRVFHEDIPIPGTDLTLHYASSRTAGYKPGVITVPASGGTVPPSLVRILVKAEVAGRRYDVVLAPEANQAARIEWDGLDHLSRPMSGSLIAHVEIGFVYNGVFYRPSRTGPAFGQPGGSPLLIPTRREMISWRSVDVPLTRGIGSIAEGWTLSHHHYVSPMDSSRIFKGDGTIGMNNTAVIENFAGDGTIASVFGGMGGPAVKAQIGQPRSILPDGEGNIYITTADLVPWRGWNQRVLKIDADGAITEEGFWGHDGPNIARDAHGYFYQSWSYYNCVYKKTAQGTMQTFGECNPNTGGGFSGDGGPAASARFYHPMGIDIDPNGNVYIADQYNHRVRRIDTAGTITTFAGNGIAASSGDNGPAVQASLNHPVDVAADRHGNIFIAEANGRRVRKVDPSGKILTVAGDGTTNFKGNGVPATETGFSYVGSIRVDRNNNLYIAGVGAHRVFKVDPTGIVTTVAGSGPMDYYQGGYAGDGGPATAARLNSPVGVGIDPQGTIYIADSLNNRVRKIGPPNARLSALMEPSDMAFSEESGLVHILSGAGLHKKTVDAATGVVVHEFSYDSADRLTAILDRFGNRTVVERDGGGTATAIVSPDGLRTSLSITSGNHLARIAYPDGRIVAFDYSADGLETRKIEPAGNSFVHAYDTNGRLSEYADEEGGHWQLTQTVLENGDIRTDVLSAESDLTTHLDRYAPGGAFETSVSDAAGQRTTAVESADGLTATILLACGMSREELYGLDPQFKYKDLKRLTEQSFSGLKRVTEVETTYSDPGSTDGIPHIVTRTYIVNGRRTVASQDIPMARHTVVSPEGRSVAVEYDPNTLLIERVHVPGLATVDHYYDQRGRLVQTVSGDRVTAYGYGSQGFLDRVTGPQGRTISFGRDAVGRVTQVVRPDQSQVQFAYDPNGNMTVLVDPLGTAHRFGYSRVNRNAGYSAPLSGSYLYRYDRDRRPTETVLPSGRIIRNVYDRGRLVRTESPEGVAHFNYLCGSRPTSIVKGDEGIDYTYDGSLLTSATMTGSVNQAIHYWYDNDFRPVQAVYAGQSTDYGYDGDGLLTQAGRFAIARDAANGLPVSVSDGQLSMVRGFNHHGEIVSQAIAANGVSVCAWIVTRDPAGSIARRSEVVSGVSAVYDYLYDVNGRITKVLKNNIAIEEYSYDENGTRVFEVNALKGVQGRAYQYSVEDHLLRAGEWIYKYDRDGFLTQKTSTVNSANQSRYFYSSKGELLAVLLPDGRRIEYVCDPLGRRIAKKVNGLIVARYLWQGLTRLLAVYDGAGSLLERFEYADDRMPVSMQIGGATYYLAYDPVGSLRLVCDASGNVIKRITYDSFGNIVEDTNPSFTVPFGFAGGLHDRDTGLVRFGYRDYDPEVGRWTAKDPIGFGGGDTDLYGYVLNDPVNAWDEKGLWNQGIHNILIGTAFSYLPKDMRIAIEKGSAFADQGKFQSPHFSHMHAMKQPGESEGNACGKMKDYIGQHLHNFRTLLVRGYDEDAYFELGMAIHPVMDYTSPAHKGFQEWAGIFQNSGYQLGKHWILDRIISEAEIRESVNLIDRVLGSY